MPGSGFVAPFAGGPRRGGPPLINVPPAAMPEPTPEPTPEPATSPADVRAEEDLGQPASSPEPTTPTIGLPPTYSAPFAGGTRVPPISIDPETGIPTGPIIAPFTGTPVVRDPISVDPETGIPDRPITIDPRDIMIPPGAGFPGGNLGPGSLAPPPSGPGSDNPFFAADPDKYTIDTGADEGEGGRGGLAGAIDNVLQQPYVPTDVSVATNYALSRPVPIPVRRVNPFDQNSPIIPPARQGVGSLFVEGG